jgi:small subunit ribosomal protein S1
MFQKGDEVEAVVLNIDGENERISLGIKQLHEDPWSRIPQTYPRGSRIQGTITKITDFGTFAEIEAGVEGLIHVSEIADEHVEDPRSYLKVGEVKEMMIIDIDSEDRKIGLSIKALNKGDAGVDYRAYLANNAQAAAGGMGTLGDALKGKLKR